MAATPESLKLNTVQTLNRLLALHARSLPMYLESAPPHRGFGDERIWASIRHIIDDQSMMVDKIADYIESLDGTPNRGEFPMVFTGMHDLSTEYIAKQVLDRQKHEVSVIEEISAALETGTPARALAQEALGAAKAHVESLEECLSTVA